jgi:putative tricarboxylic transport membrane protein
MLAFGIPGSGSTAIMLGAMMLHGLIPGPRLFVDQMPIVYGLILALLMSQVVMIVVGVGFCKSMSAIIDVPTKILAPIVAVFCVVGSFALRGSLFDVIFMATFGIIGYFMKKSGYSVIAMVLGLVLGQLFTLCITISFLIMNASDINIKMATALIVSIESVLMMLQLSIK